MEEGKSINGGNLNGKNELGINELFHGRGIKLKN
jgi:hypothetical protein